TSWKRHSLSLWCVDELLPFMLSRLPHSAAPSTSIVASSKKPSSTPSHRRYWSRTLSYCPTATSISVVFAHSSLRGAYAPSELPPPRSLPNTRVPENASVGSSPAPVGAPNVQSFVPATAPDVQPAGSVSKSVQ